MEMEYRRLGSSGLKVSALSFGAWVTFGESGRLAANRRCMEVAYEAGVNFFDNAEAYAGGAAEEVMGGILRDSGWRRDSYIVSSKVFFGIADRKPTQRGTSRKHLTDACHGALNRLGLDYLDLFYCHRHDPEVSVEEVVRTMNDLIRQGKILYWGTSEWPADRILEAFGIADRLGLEGPATEQPQYNLASRQRVEVEYRPVFEKHGLGTTTWSPLASGLLTGKYQDAIPEGSRLAELDWLREMVMAGDWEEKRRRIGAFLELAAGVGAQPAQLAIAWCLRNPRVSSVILGASRPEQLEANLRALEVRDRLDDGVADRLDELFPVQGT